MPKTYLGSSSLDDADFAASQVTSGTFDDARIPAGVTRDTELDAAESALTAAITAHIDDTTDAHDASAISIADAGNDFTATDVEGALAELQADHEADATALSDHIGDTSGAHAASAVSFSPTGSIAATDVQAAIAEVASEAGGGSVSDTAYGAGWNGDTTVAPSKNAVYDEMELRAPKTLDAVFASAGTSLTDTTPNSLTAVQWGTEEATIAQADAPTSAVVVAWLTGAMRAGPGSINANDRGSYEMQVSFNGGSSWATLGILNTASLPTTQTTRNYTASATGRATGTVTGSIQVRAMVADITQANDTSWVSGYITVIVHPQ